MYVSSGGHLYTAPFGSEMLGINDAGVPIAFWRSGYVGPMVPVKPRDPTRGAP